MNDIYREVIKITGVTPDPYRDYMIEDQIDDFKERIEKLSAVLLSIKTQLDTLSGKSNSNSSDIMRITEHFKTVIYDPESIKDTLEVYKNNVAALASWVLEMKEQPLELDYISIVPPENALPKASAGFFKKLSSGFRTFIASFFEDYNSIGLSADSKNSISVWTGWGRDQATVIKQMTDSEFTSKTGIQVNIRLVQSSLIDAILAGVGPDVAINMGRGQPVNLAMRNSAVDLSSFDTFDEVTKRFSSDAMLPYKYKDGYYGLPNTQSFFMMFYRKDILESLGLKAPDTMEQFFEMIPFLHRNNMDIALPYAPPSATTVVDSGMGARNFFTQLLLQSGGSVYSGNLRSTALDSPESVKAFEQWTRLYTEYQFPLQYDFYNRFRTGEMPLGIADYTTQNMFNLAAPEIKGLWAMAPIPGTKTADGTINREEGASGTSVIMLSNASDKENCWKFMDWWTSDSVQAEFGIQLESLLGAGGRYATANINAFEALPWKASDITALKEQWKHIKEIEEIPGGYYTSRGIENAFADVYYNNQNPKDSLARQNDIINDEIARKYKEFG